MDEIKDQTSTATPEKVRVTDPRTLLRRVLVICGLSAVAFAGPLLDLYGQNPEVFVINRTSSVGMVLFALMVAVAIPAMVFLLILGFGAISENVGTAAYASLVALLSVATGLVVARQLAFDNNWLTLLVVVGVVCLIVALHRYAHGFLIWASLALPVVLIMFLTTSPSSALIWTDQGRVEGVEGIGNPAPVVMIQLDEMPLASIVNSQGEINRDLFPNFARLADDGTWYRNALADSIATSQAIPAALTGVRGERGLSPTSLEFPDNMFTLLGAEYQMHAIEWVANMCPEEICPDFVGRAPALFNSLLLDAGVVYLHLALPAPMRAGLPGIDNSWSGFLGQGSFAPPGGTVDIPDLPLPDGPPRANWINWMERLSNGIGPTRSGPLLSYVHLPSPHVPWVTNPSGTHYVRPEQYTEVAGVGGNGRWVDEPGLARMGFQRHLYQIGILDIMLGRLFDRLDSTGTWDETMIIVVADHGASFVPGEHRRWPQEDNRDDLYRIPLFIKFPEQESGQVVDEPAFGIDILPTVVDTLEVETDWEFDGISLREMSGVVRDHEPIWWCCNPDGVSGELSVLFEQVSRNHEWVPDQSSWLAVAGTGSFASLIGDSVGDLDVETETGLQWHLEHGSELIEDDRATGMVQTYISGRLTMPPGMDPREVLVVVNGRVAGMVWLVRDTTEGASFEGMIAEELVEDGPNQVDILVPGPDGVWLSGTQADLSLTLTTDDGRTLDLEPEGNRRIQIDRIELEDEEWVLVGWSADVSAKVTSDMLHVFAGEELLQSTPPNLDNRNVVNWFDSEDLLRSGFDLRVPADLVPEGLGQLLVVSEFGERAIAEVAHLPR